MADKTGIEWTDATWNPIRGCSRVSEGCRHCYAESVAYRFSGERVGGKVAPYAGLVQLTKDGMRLPLWNGKIKFVEEHLLDPLRWKAPRRIFVNSMSDLFHENVTDEMLDKIFAVMAVCPQHTFQVLTKRPERMHAYLEQVSDEKDMQRWINAAWELVSKVDDRFRRNCEELVWPLHNVHLGVSVENQKAADERIPLLMQTQASVRFLSVEPLLGAVKLRATHNDEFDLDFLTGELINVEPCESTYRMRHWPGIDWVIVGGESGPGSRPMHPDWARSLRDQCVAARVPFFFKQWGGWQRSDILCKPGEHTGGGVYVLPDGKLGSQGDWWYGDAEPMDRVGKKTAGALLDGREWREFPEVKHG